MVVMIGISGSLELRTYHIQTPPHTIDKRRYFQAFIRELPEWSFLRFVNVDTGNAYAIVIWQMEFAYFTKWNREPDTGPANNSDPAGTGTSPGGYHQKYYGQHRAAKTPGFRS